MHVQFKLACGPSVARCNCAFAQGAPHLATQQLAGLHFCDSTGVVAQGQAALSCHRVCDSQYVSGTHPAHPSGSTSGPLLSLLSDIVRPLAIIKYVFNALNRPGSTFKVD